MTLRIKTLLIIGAAIIILVGVLYSISSTVLLRGFAEIEKQNARQDTQRVVEVLSKDMANLSLITCDYASWDDTYAFIEDVNEDYIQGTLNDGTFVALEMNLMVFVQPSGQIVFSKTFDLVNEQETSIPPVLLQSLLQGQNELLHLPDTESDVTGVMLLPEGPLLIASRPILTNEYTGPIRGTLIMGRYLNDDVVARMAETMHLSLSFQRLDNLHLPDDLAALSTLEAGPEGQILALPLTPDWLAAYTLIEDIEGKPVLLLRVDTSRSIYKQGQASVRYLFVVLLAVGIMFGALTLTILERLVLARMMGLSASVRTIGQSGNFAARVSMQGDDELSSLANDINHLLRAVERSRSELQEQEQLFENLVSVARATIEHPTLEETLQDALNVAVTLTGAERGSIFLLNELGVVTRSVLAFDLEPNRRADIIGQVMDKGLSGWVVRHRQAALVADTTQDERWLPLPHHAHQIRSALIVPIQGGAAMAGILTLHHSEPAHFGVRHLTLMQAAADQIALSIRNAQILQTTQDQHGQLQALISSTRDGVVLVSMRQSVLVINEPALRMLHLPGRPEDWLDSSLARVACALRHTLPDAARMLLAEARRVQAGGELFEGEYEAPPSTIHWLNLPVAIDRSAPLGWLLVLRDVTDERAVERLREDMTRTMVHDLRNPLSGIVASLGMLICNGAGEVTPPQRNVLEIAERSAQRMADMITSILDINRLESGRMPVNYGEFSLAGLVSETLEAQATLAQENGIHLENKISAALPAAWADVELIRRVLQNLVGNAIKFTSASSAVRVSAQARRRKEGDYLLVSVSDTGPGIPSDIQSRLFQKFVTGPQDKHGSGLGLAFCKLAIEAHGEHIWVESAPGHGATFTFSLKMSDQHQPSDKS